MQGRASALSGAWDAWEKAYIRGCGGRGRGGRARGRGRGRGGRGVRGGRARGRAGGRAGGTAAGEVQENIYETPLMMRNGFNMAQILFSDSPQSKGVHASQTAAGREFVNNAASAHIVTTMELHASESIPLASTLREYEARNVADGNLAAKQRMMEIIKSSLQLAMSNPKKREPVVITVPPNIVGIDHFDRKLVTEQLKAISRSRGYQIYASVQFPFTFVLQW